MVDLVTMLDRFNRKERFFLVASAVVGKPQFRLSSKFRGEVKSALGLEVPVDATAWVDYHLDWLYAALVLWRTGGEGPFPSPKFPPAKKGDPELNVNANQEDIDLLVAFKKGAITHLLLIEAKGVTSFGNAQLISKARRLARIFGATGRHYQDVIPHFLLASPTKPKLHSEDYRQGLKIQDIPSWMLKDGDFVHVPLPVPDDRIVIERFDKTLGKASKGGQHWRVKPAPVPRREWSP